MSRIERIAAFAVLATIFAVAAVPRLDSDLWWHLAAGRRIVETSSIPRVDPFSFTFAGKPWLNHEWLAEVLFHGIGLNLLPFFFALVITATFALVWMRMRLRHAEPSLALVILGAAFFAGSMSFGPRVQMLTLFFAALFAYGLERDTKKWHIAFPLLMLVWTNLHGGFILGIALMAIAIAGRWLESRVFPRALAISLGATILAAIVNPHGLAQLAYPFKFLVPNAFTNLILESAPTSFRLPGAIAFELLLLAALAAAARARKRLTWTDVLMLVAFTHLAFTQVRNVAVWGVVITPIVADLADARPRTRAWTFAAAAIAMLIVGLASRKATVEEEKFPTRAVAMLRATPLPPNLYTRYDWGGYAIHELYPRYRVFIDGRADTLYDAALLRDYDDAWNASPRWREVFDKRRVTTVLVDRQSFLAVELSRSPQWQLVHLDGQAAVFVRRNF